MILVCNALRNDLNHANEYVRGSMLRFLCKLKEPELLEPLVPSIKVRNPLNVLIDCVSVTEDIMRMCA